MQHLDDGILAALTDGEIPSAELEPIRQHLAGCPECRDRLEAERAMAVEADQLVEAIGLPERATPAAPLVRPIVRRPRRGPFRGLAWAASLVAAAGLGYVGRGELRRAAPAAESFEADGASAPAGQDIAVDDRVQASAPEPAEPPAASGSVSGEEREAESPARPGRQRLDSDSAPRLEELMVTGARAESSAEARRDAARSNQPLGAAAPAPRPQSLADSAARLAAKARAAAEQMTLPAAPFALQERASLDRRVLTWLPTSLEEGIRSLGGRLRLVDGMVPARVEHAGARLRLVYLLEDRVLHLEQWREGDSVAVALSAVPPLPADSLARLRERIR